MQTQTLSYEAYQLATIHNMGTPIRTYQMNKRPEFTKMGWILAITFIIIVLGFLFSGHSSVFHDILFYEIFLGILLFFALIIFLYFWLTPNTTIYICTDGLIITPHKNQSLAIHWQKIEWTIAKDGQCLIHLFTGENITLGKYIEKADELAREIEIKSQLAARDQPDNIELQYERIRNSQQSRQQQKQRILEEKNALINNETSDEAEILRKEYNMADFLSTYHAGFKGILRNKTLSLNLFRLELLLILTPILYKISFFSFLPAYSFINSNDYLIGIPATIYTLIYSPYYFSRYTRLHLYQDGLIYIGISMEGVAFSIVHYSDIEKIVFHKTNRLISPDFCYLYLTNGDKIEISGYIHSQPTLKSFFLAHVSPTTIIGNPTPARKN